MSTPGVTIQESKSNHRNSRAWKEDRKVLKEWKWKDIELGNYSDVNVKYIAGWLVLFVLFLMPFVDIILDAVLIHQIKSERESLIKSVDRNETTGFCDRNATASRIEYRNRSDTILPCDVVERTLLIMLIAYAIFALLGFLFTAYELHVAHKIIKSDDVSDSFIDPMAYRVHAVRWYSHFCFFKAVENNTENYTDQMVIFVFRTLRTSKQLLADIPHFVIALLFSFLMNQLITNDLTNRGTATTILKLALLVFRLGCVIVSLIAYPFMRWYTGARLQVYTSYLFEKVIDLTLWSQKNKFSNLPPTTNLTVTDGICVPAPHSIPVPSSPPEQGVTHYPAQPYSPPPQHYPPQSYPQSQQQYSHDPNVHVQPHDPNVYYPQQPNAAYPQDQNYPPQGYDPNYHHYSQPQQYYLPPQ